MVAFTWIVASWFFATPYLAADEPQLANPVFAYFEAMSGMTTTGATVLTDVEGLDRSLLMWRQFSQWIGGMGIIVLALAVLPRLRVGGRQLLESELPGPEVERLTASIRTVARRLWSIYLGLTVLLILALAGMGWSGADPLMTFYDAVAHAFTTMPTGGFGTKARSLEGFAPGTQWIVAIFMIVAGANFALIYAALRRISNPFRDEEFPLYLILLLLGSAAIVAKLIGRGIYEGEEAVRHAVFQAASTMTTTGYASADFNLWPTFAAMVLIALMLIGGSAGSTAGAIKVVRILILVKILRRELDQTVHHEAVVPLRLNGLAMEERTVRAVGVFVLLYLIVFILGTAALAISEAFNTGGARSHVGGGDLGVGHHARERWAGARRARADELLRGPRRLVEDDPDRPHVDGPARAAAGAAPVHAELLAAIASRRRSRCPAPNLVSGRDVAGSLSPRGGRVRGRVRADLHRRRLDRLGRRARRRRARARSRDRGDGLGGRPHLGRPFQPGRHARLPGHREDRAPDGARLLGRPVRRSGLRGAPCFGLLPDNVTDPANLGVPALATGSGPAPVS